MKAVRTAEIKLYESQQTKAYVGLAGDESFNSLMTDLIFSNTVSQDRIRAVQAPGGCGALRILSDVLYRVAPDNKIHLSDPTWGNHYPIFEGSGFSTDTYPYLNRDTKSAKEDQLLEKLKKMGPTDIVVLHGCCHNPSGAELSPAAWDEIANIAADKGFFPFVDLAYQGFGNSLDEDAYGVRQLATKVDEFVVAASCSKNFGLYRERVGCAMIVSENSTIADKARGHILSAARSAYSMPPDHGAAVVARILGDDKLRQDWNQELTSMRNRILELRQLVANTLKLKSQTDYWDFIAQHRGMFTLLCLEPDQVNCLINEYSIYLVAGGRINIAGLRNEEQIEKFADALVSVTAN